MSIAEGADVCTIFKAVDEDNNGSCNVQELQAALGKGGYIISLATCSQIIRLHDSNNDGTLDLQDFTKLHDFFSKTQKAFTTQAAGNVSASSRITTQQVHSALSELGYAWLEPPAFAACSSAFNPQRDGMFGLAEFIALVSFLKSADGTYRGFDPQRTGKVTMTMNQFVYAAANTR